MNQIAKEAKDSCAIHNSVFFIDLNSNCSGCIVVKYIIKR